MKSTPSSILPEMVIIEPDVHGDVRGHFLETYSANRYAEHGITATFVQDNISHSTQGVLRGLHYQLGKPQGKLIWAVQGDVFDVAVDIRRGSPTFGKWVGITLSSEEYNQVYIPAGFAHGFCVISQTATLQYKCTDFYSPEEERGIRWDDPSLAIEWPVTDPILSNKDSAYSFIGEITPEELPAFNSGKSPM
jgi:dTDP-4-dehydrorhamnose 3,5-epimerase